MLRLAVVEPSDILAVGVVESLRPLVHDPLRRDDGILVVPTCTGVPAVDALLVNVAPCHDGMRHPRKCVLGFVERRIKVIAYASEVDRHLGHVALAAGASALLDLTAPARVFREVTAAVIDGSGLPEDHVTAPLGPRDQVPALTARETLALRLYAAGQPLKSVSRAMAVSPETVRTYLSRVRAKYARAGRPITSKVEYTLRAIEDAHLGRPDRRLTVTDEPADVT